VRRGGILSFFLRHLCFVIVTSWGVLANVESDVSEIA